MDVIYLRRLPWRALIIFPFLLFTIVIAIFALCDVDKKFAYFLSHLPGGFPYAGSESYEYWFHFSPKIISGTLLIAMLVVAVLSIPVIKTLEKIRNPLWQSLLGNFTELKWVCYIRGAIAKLPKAAIVALWLTILAIVFSSEMIGHLKRSSDVYCPIRIQAYGGTEDIPLASVTEPFPTFAPHGGQCWPGGHSITGFLFEACFFGFYALGMRRAAWISLALAFIYGNFLGGVQVLRGQHYLSHQLWSAILCWYFSAAMFFFAEKVRDFRGAKIKDLNNSRINPAA